MELEDFGTETKGREGEQACACDECLETPMEDETVVENVKKQWSVEGNQFFPIGETTLSLSPGGFTLQYKSEMAAVDFRKKI